MKPRSSGPEGGYAESRDTLARVGGLRAALQAHDAWAEVALEVLADKGLAHHHVRLVGTGLLARIPKQSQIGLVPDANLRHQQKCFERAQPSGHTPFCAGVLPVGPALPRGALIVQEIDGPPAVLPRDLDAMAQALASLHALGMPAAPARPPLQDASDPLQHLHAEISAQARFMPQAALPDQVRAAIDSEMQALAASVALPDRPPRSLIAFDAHPGNFLMRGIGDAVLVDLEKCRYSYPGLDLAHATLYTSTTWDVSTRAVLTPDEVAGFYRCWNAALDPGHASAARPWHLPLRRAMWLWSITWCCKWRALSSLAPGTAGQGEDWSAANSDASLAEHVRDRVDHYLSPEGVAFTLHEFAQLPRILAQ
ncbi:phosphotransferase [Ramlibacter sp.]|uniref:phosphotransferase n=1 Tax=Ramlibacter sp. TaxID=1917967 RepID=UPI003D0FACA8